MPKREKDGNHETTPLKRGERPDAMEIDRDDEIGEFEDQFEDEFDSDGEVMEAGVDGRPDAEREAEQKNST